MIATIKIEIDEQFLVDFILMSFKNYSITFIQNSLAIIMFMATINHLTFG